MKSFMRKLLCFVIVLLSLFSYGQNDLPGSKPQDTLKARIEEAAGSFAKNRDYLPPGDSTNKVNVISQRQVERKEQATMLRILIGAVFFILLLIGLTKWRK